MFYFFCSYAFRVKPEKSLKIDFSDNNSIQNVPTTFRHSRYCQRSRHPYHHRRLGEGCTLRYCHSLCLSIYIRRVHEPYIFSRVYSKYAPLV